MHQGATVGCSGSMGVWEYGCNQNPLPHSHTPTLPHSESPTAPQPFTLADSGIEGLIYIIIAVLYVISKMFRKKRGEDLPEPVEQPPPGRQEMPEDLREMLETLTGQKFEPVRAPPPPPPIAYAPPPPPPGDIPKRRKQAAYEAERKAERKAETKREAESQKKIYDIGTSSQRAQSVALTVAMRSISAGMQINQMPSVTAGVSLSINPNAGIGGPGPLTFLKNREQLRRAIISRAVLGKPKCFE